MGKFIKYFDNASDFAEYYNFGEWPEGPNGEVTMVAYIGDSDKVCYDDEATANDYGVQFAIDNDTVDYSATTNTFSLKTGAFWFERIMDGMNNKTYQPGVDETGVTVSFDANNTPINKTYTIIGKWYKDDNGQKGEYIEGADVYATFTQEADPEADPVRLTFDVIYSSDGVNPTRLGNRSLTGATSMVYYDETLGDEVDMMGNIYVQNKRVFYQFPSAGTYGVTVTFDNLESLAIGDRFIYSDATNLSFYTNYPEYGASLNFSAQVPMLMNSSVESLTVGQGVTLFGTSVFQGANHLNEIFLEDENQLPYVDGQFWGLPASGTVYTTGQPVYYDEWAAALPEGWTIDSGETP